MNNTYIIADTHFFDENIIKFANRPFKTIEEMNSVIINNWNNVVNKDDKIFIVGDFFYQNTSREQIKEIVKQLNGNKYLIKGNHDNLEMFDNLNIKIYEYPIIFNDFYILSHEPLFITENMPYVNIFGHVHNNPNYKDFSSNGFCVSIERLKYKPINFIEIKKHFL